MLVVKRGKRAGGDASGPCLSPKSNLAPNSATWPPRPSSKTTTRRKRLDVGGLVLPRLRREPQSATGFLQVGSNPDGLGFDSIRESGAELASTWTRMQFGLI